MQPCEARDAEENREPLLPASSQATEDSSTPCDALIMLFPSVRGDPPCLQAAVALYPSQAILSPSRRRVRAVAVLTLSLGQGAAGGESKRCLLPLFAFLHAMTRRASHVCCPLTGRCFVCRGRRGRRCSGDVCRGRDTSVGASIPCSQLLHPAECGAGGGGERAARAVSPSPLWHKAPFLLLGCLQGTPGARRAFPSPGE